MMINRHRRNDMFPRTFSQFFCWVLPTNSLRFILRSLEGMARNFAYGQHLWEWKGSGPPVCAVCGRYLARSNCHATCGRCYSAAANATHNRSRDLIRSNPADLDPPRVPAAEPTTDPSASDSGAGTAAAVGTAATDTATRQGSRSRTRSRSPHR